MSQQEIERLTSLLQDLATKVKVQTTAFVHVHSNFAAKTAKVQGASSKVKVYVGSTITLPKHYLTGSTP